METEQRTGGTKKHKEWDLKMHRRGWINQQGGQEESIIQSWDVLTDINRQTSSCQWYIKIRSITMIFIID